MGSDDEMADWNSFYQRRILFSCFVDFELFLAIEITKCSVFTKKLKSVFFIYHRYYVCINLIFFLSGLQTTMSFPPLSITNTTTISFQKKRHNGIQIHNSTKATVCCVSPQPHKLHHHPLINYYSFMIFNPMSILFNRPRRSS